MLSVENKETLVDQQGQNWINHLHTMTGQKILEHILRYKTKIRNYRVSRAQRVVENTSGIMASRFRVIQTAINLDVQNIGTVVITCCVLHNFLRRICPQNYICPEVLDRENVEDGSVELGERCDPDVMHSLQLGRRRLVLEDVTCRPGLRGNVCPNVNSNCW
jgi:hypothetical protein